CPNVSVRLKAMGLGPPILALYRQLKLLGALDGIDSVVELGSQGVWCPDRRLLTGFFEAVGRPVAPGPELDGYMNCTRAGPPASPPLHHKPRLQYASGRIPGHSRSRAL